jgi:enterochelin esterase-like enzyme
MSRLLSRRSFVVGGAAAAGAVAVGGAGLATGHLALPDRVQRMIHDEGPDGVIPDVPAGTVELTRQRSAARGREVGFWTAVPDGLGAGAGLPVCLVLHGASATTANFTAFGFAKFLTAAVRSGVPPFVLAGADGGETYWRGNGPGSSDDPQRMLRDEIPSWCAARGWDTSRIAAYGWSMGGHGALLAAEEHPGWLRSVSALSPAIGPGDDVFAGVAHLARSTGTSIGIWCGESDPLLPAAKQLARDIEGGAAVAAWDKGAHRRVYWNRVTPAAFALAGHALAA